MAFFIGEFEQTVDAKHRLAINASLRDSMDPDEDGKDFVLILGPDRHLWLYPDALYRKMLQRLGSSPIPDRQSRKVDMMFAMARLLKMDAQGRIVLPEKSMQRAVIKDSVTLLGQNDHIAIWPTDEWERHVEAALPGYGEMVYEAADQVAADNKENA